MEHKETIYSEDRLNGRKSLVAPPKRGADGVKSAFEVEVRIRETPFRRPGASKIGSRLSNENPSPTGC